MNRSTEANIEKLLNDYKKLKVENEVLLERIQSYKEKYEKKWCVGGMTGKQRSPKAWYGGSNPSRRAAISYQ